MYNNLHWVGEEIQNVINDIMYCITGEQVAT